ncbi:MAG: MFS transporter [Spirochaetes bacterium]|nr:MFS transporter [Spirochaetota bacterium]
MKTSVKYYGTPGFMAALLSLSLLTIMAGAGVASGLSGIAAAFPGVSETAVKLVISLPPLFMIIASLLTGMLGRAVRHRALVVIGLLLFIVGGVGAGCAGSMEQLLVLRALLGFGTGMILPFTTGLIASCYDGAEKNRMMGLSFAANNLGAIAGNILSGVLCALHWRYMFHVYWIGAVSLLLVILFLKRLPVQGGEGSGGSLSRAVLGYSFIALLVMMAFYLIIANLSLMVSQRGIGGPRTAGMLFAVNSLTMLGAGLLLPCATRIGRWFLPAALLLMATGFAGFAVSSSAEMLLASAVASGMGLGLLFPHLLGLASQRIGTTAGVRAMSVIMASAWLGQFLSPLCTDSISALTGIGVPGLFLAVAVACTCLAAAASVSSRPGG